MSSALGWIAAVCFLVAWIAAEQGKRVEAHKASIAYTQGLTEGARLQALKPCSWQQLFSQKEMK